MPNLPVSLLRLTDHRREVCFGVLSIEKATFYTILSIGLQLIVPFWKNGPILYHWSAANCTILYHKTLSTAIVRKRLSMAVDQRDHLSILRFIKLFPPLGLKEEGLKVYVAYLKKDIRSEFEQLLELMEQQQSSSVAAAANQQQVDFAARLTTLFKDIVLAIEENSQILRSLCGEDAIVYAICELQKECDSRGSLVLKKYMDYRKLAKLTSEINSYKSSNNLLSVGVEGPDPREIILYLDELLPLTKHGEDYTKDMISKIRGLSSVDPELGPRAIIKAFRSGNFSKVAQDITGYYVILEGFFMVKNVRKAINIDEHVPDSLTTSMVDDVFSVLGSCCRRSLLTSNINSVIAVLSSAVGLLGSEYNEALQHKMRETNLEAKLFLGGVGVQEVATALNNMDISAEYALKLRQEIEEECVKVFPAPADREGVKSCFSELGELSNSFKTGLNVGMEQVVATVTPSVRSVLDSVASINYELSEAEYADNKVNDRWVQRLLHSVESNVAWF